MMQRRTSSTATLRRVTRRDATADLPAPAPEPREAGPGRRMASPAPIEPSYHARPARLGASRDHGVAPNQDERDAERQHERSAYAPASGENERTPDDAVGIAEFGQILAQRWKTILGTMALSFLLASALAFLVPKKYTATTSIFIDPRNRAAFQIESSAIPLPFDANLVDSQAILIESETVLRRVVESERLVRDEEFAKGPGEPMGNALRNLKEAVKVKRPERTYVIDLQVRAKEADKAARLANAIAQAYLSDGSDAKTNTVSREQEWLIGHLKNLEQRLRTAEARVDEYKTKNRIFGAEGRLVGEQQLSQINLAMAEAQRKVAETKATLDQVEGLRRAGKLPDSTNEALRSGVIERLRTQQAEIQRLEANSRMTLGPRHPASMEVREQLGEVQRQITQELGRIAENARSAYALARSNMQGLERELNRQKKDSTDTSHTLLGLRELERAVEAQKAVYEKFLRDKEAIARLSVDTPAGRVIQKAEIPPRPSFPNKPLFMALGAVGGLFLGVGIALLMETLARANGASSGLGGTATGGGLAFSRHTRGERKPQPVLLATVPGAHKTGFFSRAVPPAPDAVLSAPQAPYAQAVQALAARLPQQPAMALLVSGLEAGSANPVLTLNLALALAQQGRAVLLLDSHGGTTSLTAMLSQGSSVVEMMVAGQRQRVLRVPVALAAPLYLLPFSALPAARKGVPRVPPAEVTLIDGPALRSAAFAQLDMDAAIDGVLVVLPPGAKAPARALKAELADRIGPALLGLVGQGA